MRLHDIARESFWLDEAGRAAIAHLPLSQIPGAVSVVELSPPLYHLLLHVWMLAFGDTDAALRLFSAVLVVPTVAVAWSLGTAVAGPRSGLLTAVLAALHPFAIRYGQEAGMYALLLCLSLATTRAAVDALATGADTGESARALRKRRARGLAAYVVFGALSLYTHYYAVYLLASVALVGVARSAQQRSRHGLVLWSAAHGVIALAFVPWLPAMAQQARLAASVTDWDGVTLAGALTHWCATALADGAPWSQSLLSVLVLVWLAAAGVMRIGRNTPSIWLMGVIAVGPAIAAGLVSLGLHSFRDRGFMVAVGATWVLLAAAIGGVRDLPRFDRAGRAFVAVAAAAMAISGIVFDATEHKEDWRGAAGMVAGGAGINDPIFLIHYGAQIPFDRYFSGSQPRIGLPANFDWTRGYAARYVATTADIEARVVPALEHTRQAWAVLSHDEGRGSATLLAALDRWGTPVEDRDFHAVRVVRYRARGA
ncbi:MAG TPA: glycosyltransferase family 39 protein [Chloroflexota bacterium]|nr:glycosyltransferase family 39 protein [Chloroflexota bacterium]